MKISNSLIGEKVIEMVRYTIDPKIKMRKIDELVELPHTILVNDFSELSAKTFRAQFQTALNSNQPVIPIVIDSFGGQVYSLLSMMGVIKASPVPVATVITGKSMSCGAVLASCGTEGMRFIDPLATVMIHDLSQHSGGKTEEFKASAKEIERLNQLVFRLMAEHVGHPSDYFLKLADEMKHAEIYLSPEECKTHKLVNHIRVPQFNVKLSVDINFG
jgi:ATP-dependent Clp protease, protease subunit